MKMYTIRDATTELFFGRIFLFENDAHAIRVFKDVVTNKDDPMGQHPDDYTLYYVGTYDDSDGIPMGEDPRRVITGVEAVRQRGFDLEKLQELNKEIEAIKKNGANLQDIHPGGTD
jgi:hypothetical protein